MRDKSRLFAFHFGCAIVANHEIASFIQNRNKLHLPVSDIIFILKCEQQQANKKNGIRDSSEMRRRKNKFFYEKINLREFAHS